MYSDGAKNLFFGLGWVGWGWGWGWGESYTLVKFKNIIYSILYRYQQSKSIFFSVFMSKLNPYLDPPFRKSNYLIIKSPTMETWEKDSYTSHKQWDSQIEVANRAVPTSLLGIGPVKNSLKSARNGLSPARTVVLDESNTTCLKKPAPSRPDDSNEAARRRTEPVQPVNHELLPSFE